MELSPIKIKKIKSQLYKNKFNLIKGNQSIIDFIKLNLQLKYKLLTNLDVINLFEYNFEYYGFYLYKDKYLIHLILQTDYPRYINKAALNFISAYIQDSILITSPLYKLNSLSTYYFRFGFFKNSVIKDLCNAKVISLKS